MVKSSAAIVIISEYSYLNQRGKNAGSNDCVYKSNTFVYVKIFKKIVLPNHICNIVGPGQQLEESDPH